MNLFS